MPMTVAGQEKIVRIGGASGFWGDSRVAAPQLVRSGRIDYLVFDYLAETTMAILVGARAKKPELGYATDFVDVAMRPVLREIAAAGIKVVSNAGGINPHGCAEALARLVAEQGLSLRIAVVEGDDVSGRLRELVGAGTARGVRRPAAAGTGAERQRLSRRAADRRGARRRRRHRHHRALRRQRGHPRAADARVRLVRDRLGPPRRRRARRPHHRMRLPGDRRPLHRLAERAGLGDDRLSDRRLPGRRQLHPEQGRGHRRPGGARAGRRAAALRDRRSRRLRAARRDLRLPRRDDRGGGRRPGACRRCPRPAADRRYKVSATAMQGFRAAGHAGDRRHRRGREGQAHRRGDPRADPHAARARPASPTSAPRTSRRSAPRPRTARTAAPARHAR